MMSWIAVLVLLLQRRQKIVKKMGEVEELPEEFRPPDWLTDTKPRKTPYVPQMGDEVMYFRQGHSLYLQAVKRHNAYNVNPMKNQPWHKYPHLRVCKREQIFRCYIYCV